MSDSKSRNINGAGKDDRNRITDLKKFGDRYVEINWASKKGKHGTIPATKSTRS